MRRWWMGAVVCWLGMAGVASGAERWQDQWTELNRQVYDLTQQGQFPVAIATAEAALQVAEHRYGPQSAEVAKVLNSLGTIYTAQGNFALADQHYQQALAIIEHELGMTHPAAGVLLVNLGELRRREGRYAEGEPLLRRALALRIQSFGKQHLAVADAQYNLGGLLRSAGRYDEARDLFAAAAKVWERGRGHQAFLVQILDNYADCLTRTGDARQAEQVAARATKIRSRLQ